VKVGYARVSSRDQRLEAQRDALLTDSCERVFEEKVSSREAERKALREAFDYCRKGDVLVVTSLDRLGRSLRELIDLVGELEKRPSGSRASRRTSTPRARVAGSSSTCSPPSRSSSGS
jgi:DNA invertase Pin-like site-specific DNA recombinase